MFRYLILPLVLFFTSFFNLAAQVTALKGNGSPEDPFLISTAAELKWMRDMVNGDLLFSINDLTSDERERIRYGVEVFIKLLQEKIDTLKISLNREASFRYKGKQENGKILLERVFVP